MSENFESTYESSIPNQDFWENGGISLTGNPHISSDTISFTRSHLPGGMGEDHINLTGDYVVGANSVPMTIFGGEDCVSFDSSPTFNIKMNNTKNNLWKYNEDKILKEIQDYVTSTYHGHYCGDSDGYADIQTIDLMAAKKLAAGFCQANILKYGSRYGDKDGRNKRDLMKVIHYAMLLLHFDGHYTRKDNGLSEFTR